MSEFEERYRSLNAKQKEAVDTIEGPVMVVAGPGTGKTELLGLRVANILKKTDVSPSNILCLTFTESGAQAMRDRLLGLIGQDAYKVNVNTFHSFGSEVIHNNPDYFYRGAHFRPADELSSYEVLRGLFEKLPHDSPIASSMNGEFTALRDTQRAISYLKQSGLTPDELLTILDHNESFISYASQFLPDVFAPRLSKTAITQFEEALLEIGKYQDEPIKIIGFEPLSTLFMHSAERAINACREQNDSTKPLRAWRDDWLEKDDEGKFVFKDVKRSKKLRAVAGVYYDYLVAMQEREMYDFDDMILRVVHGLEVFGELRLNLQEQHQYILVDEFQDTNNAQMRLLWNLTNNEVMDGQPNLLVVGDDDQAIYRFQGADISNILDFTTTYKDPGAITLTDNYRSADTILNLARSVITQGEERLENTLQNINKTLTPHNTAQGSVSLHMHASAYEEYYWIATSISQKIKEGAAPSSIAVIARNHSDLQALLPYFSRANIPIRYDRQDNILESEPIKLLELLANVVNSFSHQQFDEVDALLPELLAHPAWHVDPKELWHLGLSAYKNRSTWIEAMLDTKNGLRDIAEWLIISSHAARHEPLEPMLDVLLGTDEHQAPDQNGIDPAEPSDTEVYEGFVSPLRNHFFPASTLQKQPDKYLSYLSALTTLRRRLREYRPDKTLTLSDFCDFLRLHRKTGIAIAATDEFQPAKDCVQLMTAHKAKGLEFETVFVTSLNDKVWGTKSRARASSIGFPHNLPLAPVGTTDDERLRLLYVALTRAKSELVLNAHTKTSGDKDASLAAYLSGDNLKLVEHPAPDSNKHLLEVAETTWQNTVTSLPNTTAKNLLAPVLQNYALSATHINNFLDVSQGGPQAFLLQNLLRFPQAMSPSAAFGSAVHATLQRAHAHLSATGKRRPVEDVLSDFEQQLSKSHLSQRDMEFYLHKGSDVLHKFLSKRYDSFTDTQIVERSFANQGVVIDNVRLTGAIDVMDIDAETKKVTVTDYKTGKFARTWQGKTDFEKIKLHKYKQQLMLYKLLVEHARDFGQNYKVEKGVLEFVEPAPNGDVVQLELTYSQDDIEQFKKLFKVVWQHITDFNLPDTSQYEPSYKGMLAFEQDLLQGKI